MDCIFCKIIKGEIPAVKIYEDENCLAFLNIKPVNRGHALVVHKEHHDNLYEMPDECLAQIAPQIKKVAIAVKDGVNADGINVWMNNGAAAGQVIFHAHFHIIPRFTDDGYRFTNDQPGHPGHVSYAEGEMEKIAEKIKNKM